MSQNYFLWKETTQECECQETRIIWCYLRGRLLYPVNLINKHWDAVAEKPNVSQKRLVAATAKSKGKGLHLCLPKITAEESENIDYFVFLCFSFSISAIQESTLKEVLK